MVNKKNNILKLALMRKIFLSDVRTSANRPHACKLSYHVSIHLIQLKLIKEVRERKNMGLREAKEIVDDYLDEHPAAIPATGGIMGTLGRFVKGE